VFSDLYLRLRTNSTHTYRLVNSTAPGYMCNLSCTPNLRCVEQHGSIIMLAYRDIPAFQEFTSSYDNQEPNTFVR
jgi:hypothetical protein